jgi:hypothetical protein
METNRRFSILTFPQFFDGARLTLNVVVLPRNQNPLLAAIEGHPSIPDGAPAFADAAFSFEAKIITGSAGFPQTLPDATRALLAPQPARARELFEALRRNFDIEGASNPNTSINGKADAAKAVEQSVKKYLPDSYRTSFNFTTPRSPGNGVTDDSYHCAVRGAGLVPGFKQSTDTVSWGRVFAYALRQPVLAEQLGMLYRTSFDVEAGDFPAGGWLYVDLADPNPYADQQLAAEALPGGADTFYKRYAARIPPLRPGAENSRQVFAPLLFPVMPPAKPPDGNFDELFIETSAYDDGFAKIVHAHQPRSRNLLLEESDGAHPVKDAGIRLGWDDEQILVWYMRQLAADPTVTDAGKRLDAPLGVFGYAVDVRDSADVPDAWSSLNEVMSRDVLSIPVDKNTPDDVIALDGFEGELPYQVYPSQLDGDDSKPFWLPMYFANWNGNSIVLPDADAARIYQTTNPLVKPDTKTNIRPGGAKNQLGDIYEEVRADAALLYGHGYKFRVRLRDMSGGGPSLVLGAEPINESPAGEGACDFKRFVAPNRLRVEALDFNTDTPRSINQLTVRRPLLGYPAAIYTGRYGVQALADAAEEMRARSELGVAVEQGKEAEAFGVADPDVDRVEVTVEVQTLRMDNLLSISGKESYVHLYTTRRRFPAAVAEADFETALEIPVTFRDCRVLHTGDERDVRGDFGLPDEIDNIDEIVLPRARTVRLTLRAVCEDKARNHDYYGLLDDANGDTEHPDERKRAMDVRFGQVTQLTVYEPSTEEGDLFVDAAPAEMLRGIFLQPDPPAVFDGQLSTLLFGGEAVRPPDMIQRLAGQLDLTSINLTLTARKGERVQFGCSSRIRHTLSPDNSSVTFAAKGDLMNHWLCCVTLTIDRDWTWDALEDRAFVVKRTKRFTRDAAAEAEESMEVGDIEVRHTAPFEALNGPRRNYTRLVFIDAVEPKNERPLTAGGTEPRFPDTIEVSYSVEPRFKPDHTADPEGPRELPLRLPITAPPTQIPKIASAGLALSPYVRNDKYSATEPRRRFLWIEFAEPVQNPDDTYFARVLVIAPDQLISNNHPELWAAPDEPALPLDPEYTRVVTDASANDFAGLDKMQLMQRATDSGRHYLLPLPHGLHAEADEMFGFFTYEFRVGHYRRGDAPPEEDEKTAMVWSTEQGRYGRPLRATGIQHPAPTLICTVNRDEEKLYVSAPYAVAVFDGRNVTADPPRTQLWCLLYAQVRQADDRDFRNILLDDRQLDWRIEVEHEREVNWLFRYDRDERLTLKGIASRNAIDELAFSEHVHLFKLKEKWKSNADATKQGTVVWSDQEVKQLLQLYGLPGDSSLSVLVVEVLPHITNLRQHITNLNRARATSGATGVSNPLFGTLAYLRATREPAEQPVERGPSPLSDALGHHRILRTSPLTEVPPICCTDC